MTHRAEDLQPYQLRVVEEKEALDVRIAALRAFMDGPVFKTAVPADECYLLGHQACLMMGYSQCLGERIAGWGKEHEQMTVFRRQCAPSDGDPLGEAIEDVAIPTSRLGEVTIAALPPGVPQNLWFTTRGELNANHPKMVRL